MKKLFFTFVFGLCLFLNIFAFISPFVPFNTNSEVVFSNESGIQIKNNHIWVLYLEKGQYENYVKLAYSDNYGASFNHLLIDTIILSPYLQAPVMSVDDDLVCSIFYVKKNPDTSNFDLHAVKVANQQITQNLVLDSGLKTEPLLNRCDNNLVLTFKSHWYKQLAFFQYYTENELNDLSDSNLNARSKFNGLDSFSGRVHSNSDIWIQNGSGSGTPVNYDAPGWPLFTGIVSTTGKFMNHSTNSLLIGSPSPVDAIFQGAYIENADSLSIVTPTMTNMVAPFGYVSENYQDKIFKVVISGSSLSIRILDCTQTHVDSFVVYDRYPDALHPVIPGNESTYIGNRLWTNYITVRDTVWGAPIQISFNNQGLFLPGTVWIEGQVSGKLSIYTPEDAYITGNITYTGTEIGQSPDNNPNDYFGLVSGKKIIIKYKYREPIGNGQWITHANNSQGPNGNVFLYGAFAALGRNSGGEYGFKDEGVFTYEYQHPHGAVTPYYGISQYTGQDTLYSFIDLHRHQFPPISPANTNMPLWQRWPNQTSNDQSLGFPNNNISTYDYTQTTGPILYKTSDYPWINPVWPEKDGGPLPNNLATDITWERGTIIHFGSIAQMRRGFIHRSGTSNANINPDTGEWNPPYVLGPPHRSTGYNKSYHADPRFENNPLPWFPSVLLNDFDYKHKIVNQQFELVNQLDLDASPEIYNLKVVSNSNRIVIAYQKRGANDQLFIKVSVNNGETYENITIQNIPLMIDLCLLGDQLQILYFETTIKLMHYNFDTQINPVITLMNNVTNVSNTIKPRLILTKNNNILLFIKESNQHNIYSINTPSNPVLLESFTMDNIDAFSFVTGHSDSLYIIAKDYLSDNPQGNWTDISTVDNSLKENWANLYFAKAFLNGITPNDPQNPLPERALSLSAYPNPFNPDIKIEFYLPSDGEVNLHIFNIKGQKVQTIVSKTLEKGLHQYTFNGKDEQQKNLSSGIYFVKILTKEKTISQKIILLK